MSGQIDCVCGGRRIRRSSPNGPLRGQDYCERGLSCQMAKPTGEPSAPQEHAPTCQSWRCAWEWRTESGAGVCRLPKDADIHYVGTVDSHEFKPLPCTCAAPQEPSERQGDDEAFRRRLERAAAGALRMAIAAHGDVTASRIGSAAKRVSCQVLTVWREECSDLAARLAQTEKGLLFTTTRLRNCRTLGDAVWQALRASEDDNPVVLIEQLQDRLAQTERDRDEARTKLAEAEQLASHAAQECVTATELLVRERTRSEQAEKWKADFLAVSEAVARVSGFPPSAREFELMAERDTLQRERDDLRRRVEEFWSAVDWCYDIEPREFFEKEAESRGFTSPVAMAVHWMWKRDVNYQTGRDVENPGQSGRTVTP